MEIFFQPVTQAEDIRTVVRLAETIWPEHYIPIIGRSQVAYMLATLQSEEAIDAQIHEGLRYYLILQAKRPVGYLAVRKQGPALFLSKIYILAEMRNRGIGRQAIALVESVALSEGCIRIALTVNKFNRASIEAYKRLGFSVTGVSVAEIGQGFIMDDYRMEKSLD